MIRTQSDRRNLTKEQILHYEMMRLDLEKKQAKKRQGTRTDLLPENKDNIKNIRQILAYGNLQDLNKDSHQGKALNEIAKRAGTNWETARQYSKIKEAGKEEEVLKQGKSINAVFKELRKEGKTQYADIEFPSKNYRVVYADLVIGRDYLFFTAFNINYFFGGASF